MAKLKAPLMSLGASGQLGKALVFFGWKGLNVVREYVVPSNPKTALQTTQRGYMTAAVAMVHTAQGRAVNALNAIDVTAYSAWALVVKAATTWFNQACKSWIDAKVDSKTPIIYSDGETTVKTPIPFSCIIYLNEETGSDLANGKFFFGVSKTALINPAVGAVVLGDNVYLGAVDLSAFLTAGVKYFWQFRPDVGDPCEGANSGIYTFVAE